MMNGGEGLKLKRLTAGDWDVLDAVLVAEECPAARRGDQVAVPAQELQDLGEPGLGQMSRLPLHL